MMSSREEKKRRETLSADDALPTAGNSYEESSSDMLGDNANLGYVCGSHRSANEHVR